MEYLDRGESKSILKNKIPELALTRNMYREEKIEENMNAVHGEVFGHFTQSLKSGLKRVPDYENKPEDCDCFFLMGE